MYTECSWNHHRCCIGYEMTGERYRDKHIKGMFTLPGV